MRTSRGTTRLAVVIMDSKNFKEPIVVVRDCEYTIDLTNDYEDIHRMVTGPIVKRTGTTITIRMTEEKVL